MVVIRKMPFLLVVANGKNASYIGGRNRDMAPALTKDFGPQTMLCGKEVSISWVNNCFVVYQVEKPHAVKIHPNTYILLCKSIFIEQQG